MVTTARGGRQVTSNLSWILKVVPLERGVGTGGVEEEECGEFETGDGSQSGQSTEESRRTEALGHDVPVRVGSPDEQPAGRSEARDGQIRYHLRPNPNPSQRLKDFLC
ncbi:hypothetical protein NDU88_002466 [Pleurodeles waltl]|uniref:Uncharacterized protein n=1 Tax=Pleurodeles waltl TaxID=8319 RepID=A0AAV7UXE8_PLEWA|nr:hypothetical protein NDU88_002466 [Pleurodeles waltl]